MTLLQLAGEDNRAIWLHWKSKRKPVASVKAFAASAFLEVALSARLRAQIRRSSYHLPGSQQRMMWLAPPVTLPWKGHFDSSACSYLSWEIKCVFQRVFIRLMKVFRRLFCCCLIWFMTELSGVRFLFGLWFLYGYGWAGVFFFFLMAYPPFLKHTLSQRKQKLSFISFKVKCICPPKMAWSSYQPHYYCLVM